MGTPFKMKGSKFYGRGNQSPVSQIGGLPEKVAPVRPAPSAPAAPSAARFRLRKSSRRFFSSGSSSSKNRG